MTWGCYLDDPELLDNGHEVVGLARSEESAEAVAALDAEVRRGDLDDLDGLRAAAAEADGVIHLNFKHEAMLTGDFMSAVESDMAAHRAIGEALIGTDKPFVSLGGTLMLAMAGINGRPGTEDDESDGGPRTDAANYTIGLARRLRQPQTIRRGRGRAAGVLGDTVELMLRDVPIRGETINLGQLLKLEGVIGSGAEVKTLLSTETVWVNGEPEARRGRKLHHDDVVRVGELELRVTSATP